jgi:hypothetical protein
MSQEAITLYTVNEVINIDNTTKNLIVAKNPLQVFKNLNDANVSEVFRVVDGSWFDRIKVNNIFAHSADEDISYLTGMEQGVINIGESGNEINVNGKTITITSVEADSETTINGKTLTAAETTSTTKLLGITTQVGTKNADLDPLYNSSITEICGKSITINEYDKVGTQTIINGKTVTLCDTNKAGTQTNINGKSLNLGENSSTVVVKGIDTTIATFNQASTTNIYGSNLNIGEDVSTLIVKANDTKITTAGQSGSVTTINGKTINLAENDSTLVINGQTTTVTTAGQVGSETTINGKTVNIAENDSTVIVKGITTTIATVGQIGSETTINGKTVHMAEDDSTVLIKGQNMTVGTSNLVSETLVNGRKVTLGEDRVNTDLYVYSEDVFIGTELTTQNIKLEADNFALNDSSKAGYINVNNTALSIDIGSTLTDTLNIKANTINIDAENGANEIYTKADVYKINQNSVKTYFEINDTANKIVIGGDELDEATLNGSNVFIGKGGGNVTIYGNLIQYSEGSNVNIVTNTTTEETSAFQVHNTGTKTALTVIQDNKVSGGGYNLVEFYTQENQDRIPFRVDELGRVGLGVSGTSNLQAWLHVNRNDPDIIGPDYDDLLLVEDSDNDNTPFIIKKEGDIGIGTKVPKYKLDVWTTGSELNGQGDVIRSKGIALRDVVYVKQNETNRILFGLGNKLYIHDPVDRLDNIFKTGFTFEHDLTDTQNPFNTDLSDGTFVFRMTCKMHIAGDDGNVAFRKFEAFINPQNGTFNNKQMPAHILLTDYVDSVYEHYEFSPTVSGVEYKTTVENVNGTTWRLVIPWKLRSINPKTDAAFTSYPAKSRVYLDVEFFGSEDIGDIKAEPLHLKDNLQF